MGSHLIDGEFQSDKYPTCPAGKVPLSTKDPMAQDLLWTYAQRRRKVDAEFADDLEAALRMNGYVPRAVRIVFNDDGDGFVLRLDKDGIPVPFASIAASLEKIAGSIGSSVLRNCSVVSDGADSVPATDTCTGCASLRAQLSEAEVELGAEEAIRKSLEEDLEAVERLQAAPKPTDLTDTCRRLRARIQRMQAFTDAQDALGLAAEAAHCQDVEHLLELLEGDSGLIASKDAAWALAGSRLKKLEHAYETIDTIAGERDAARADAEVSETQVEKLQASHGHRVIQGYDDASVVRARSVLRYFTSGVHNPPVAAARDLALAVLQRASIPVETVYEPPIDANETYAAEQSRHREEVDRLRRELDVSRDAATQMPPLKSRWVRAEDETDGATVAAHQKSGLIRLHWDSGEEMSYEVSDFTAGKLVPEKPLRFGKEQYLTGHYVQDRDGSGINLDDGSTFFFLAFIPPEALPPQDALGLLSAKVGPSGRWRITVEFEPTEPTTGGA